ncbi:MAG: hypothetical protein GX633_02390 [Clostridiales bacterium]|nr:hypothetical protein [Clostridiales bacterium]
MKKALAILLAALILITMFAGCQKKSSNDATSSSSESKTETKKEETKKEETKKEEPKKEEPKKEDKKEDKKEETKAEDDWKYEIHGPLAPEPTELSFLTHSGHASTLAIPSRDLPIFQSIEEQTNLIVDWQVLENAVYSETINVRLMSQDLPNMVVLLDNTLANDLVMDGMFWAYDDLDFDYNAPNARISFDTDSAFLEDIYRSIYEDGKIYAFGNTVEPRYLFNNHLINMRWLEVLGVDEPSTNDELVEVLKMFRDQDVNGNGDPNDEIPMAKTGNVNTVVAHSFDFNVTFPWVIDENGNLKYCWITDNAFDMLTFRNLLYEENLIDRENRDMTANYELIAQDRLGLIDYFATFQRTINSYSPYYTEKFVEGMDPAEEEDLKQNFFIFRELLPMECVYTGKRQMYSRITTGVGEGMYIIKDGNDIPEICLRFSDWLWAGSEWNTLRNFGIEGWTFDYNEEGVPVRYDVPIGWDVAKDGEFSTTSIGMGQPPWTNRQFVDNWKATYPKYMNERATAMQEYYIDGPLPLVFNAEDSATLSELWGDVNTYRDEMHANFIEGRTELNEANWQAYVDELWNIGLEEITEIYNERYHEING